MGSSPGIDPEPHRWEASAITTKWLETENEILNWLETHSQIKSQLSSQQNKNLFTLIDGEPILIDTFTVA